MMLQVCLTITNTAHRFRRQLSGATAIEYGLLIAGIALVVGIALAALGVDMKKVYEDMAALLS